MMKITKGLENKIRREVEKWEKDEVLTYTEMFKVSMLYTIIHFTYRGEQFKMCGSGEVFYEWGDIFEHTGYIGTVTF